MRCLFRFLTSEATGRSLSISRGGSTSLCIEQPVKVVSGRRSHSHTDRTFRPSRREGGRSNARAQAGAAVRRCREFGGVCAKASCQNHPSNCKFRSPSQCMREAEAGSVRFGSVSRHRAHISMPHDCQMLQACFFSGVLSVQELCQITDAA